MVTASEATLKSRAYKKAWYLKNKKRLNLEGRINYRKNRVKILARNKKYIVTVPIEKRRVWSNAWARRNPHYCRNWRAKNLDRAREAARSIKKRLRATPKGCLDHRMNSAILGALKSNKAGRRWENLVGYTLDELKNRIESQFSEGMTWEKLVTGEIHIDHKIPKSRFSYTTAEDHQFVNCWSLNNLQPLWARDNMLKGSKL